MDDIEKILKGMPTRKRVILLGKLSDKFGLQNKAYSFASTVFVCVTIILLVYAYYYMYPEMYSKLNKYEQEKKVNSKKIQQKTQAW